MISRYLVSILVLSATLFVSACASSPVVLLPPPTTVQVAVQAAPTDTAVPTDTQVPPSATNTEIPPAPTDTAVPPTPVDTVVPPTETSTPEPTVTFTATRVPPTATRTRVPATRTRAPVTATRKPTVKPTAKPAAAKLLSVDWKTNMEYNPRDGSSNWCQMHNQYQNNDTEDVLFTFSDKYPEPPPNPSSYGPIFGIANADGTINRWRQGGWYSRLLGWPNGIPGFPPPIPAGVLSDDWTWYSIAQTNGEFCRYVYVKYKGQVSAAEYAPNGELINRSAALPEGAP